MFEKLLRKYDEIVEEMRDRDYLVQTIVAEQLFCERTGRTKYYYTLWWRLQGKREELE